MSINLVKLLAAVVLIPFFVVAIGVDWIDGTWGYGIIGLLVGYVIGNAHVAPANRWTAPVVSREPTP